jgi:predicted Zn finger-like uncharacterized protein
MRKKRPDRSTRHGAGRAARQLVRDRERLAALVPGGSADRPIDVPSSAVIETRAEAQRCPQCDGPYRIDDHQAPSASLRELSVQCQRCGVARRLWFRIIASGPN